MAGAQPLQLLKDYNRGAYLAARALSAAGPEHLLAEADLSSVAEVCDLAECIAAVVDELGESLATSVLWADCSSACAFYLIDAGRRQNEGGKLYPFIVDETGLAYRLVTEWADRFLEYLDQAGLWRFHSQEAHKYKWESILMHGGLPDDAWKQIWRNWILPELDLRPDIDVAGLIEAALADSLARPSLRLTTLDILTNGGEMVARLVGNALQAARSVLRTGFVDEAGEYGLPSTALASLQAVLDAPKLRWPDLVFDQRGSCPVALSFPEQRLPVAGFRDSAQAAYDVYASGGEGARLAGDVIPALRRSAHLVIDPVIRPLPPSPGFDAVLRFEGIARSGEAQEHRIRWRASSAAEVWVFYRDRFGKYTSPILGSRPRPHTAALYLVKPGLSLESTEGARTIQVTPLWDAWGGWTAHEVDAPSGGTVAIRDADRNTIAAWSIGQTFTVQLVGDDELAVGSLIAGGGPAPRAYGRELPAAVVAPIDPSEELVPEKWTCQVEWCASGTRSVVTVPFVLTGRGFELRADLNTIANDLPALVSDGLIRVEGPKGAGCLRRAFVRAPLAKPKPLSVNGSSLVSGLQATYLLRTGLLLPAKSWYGKDLGVRRSADGDGYLFDADLALDKVSITVAEGSASIPMNLALLGSSVQVECADPRLFSVDRVPKEAVDRNAGAFVRVRTHSQSGATLQLKAVVDGVDIPLRSVGVGGRYSESLGLGEFAAAVDTGRSAALRVTLKAGAFAYEEDLLKVIPGLGLGDVAVSASGGRVSVGSENPALLPVRLLYKDLTRPWRTPAEGTLEIGQDEASLAPAFPSYVGHYALWAWVKDEWVDSLECVGEPLAARVVGPDDPHDPDAPMGPYMRGLCDLLLSQAGLGPRPRLASYTKPPGLGLLEQDAEATVSTVRTALMGGASQAASFGAEVMGLPDYRYPVCPPVLRALAQPGAVQCSRPHEPLSVALGMRLHVLPLRRQNSGAFEPEELRAAWATEPFIGLVASQLHALSGADPDEARLPAARWLGRIGVHDPAEPDLLGQVRACRGTLVNVTEGARHCNPTRDADSATTREFVRWHESQTTKDLRDVAGWLSEHVARLREALGILDSGAPALRMLVRAVSDRDAGDRTKTIALLPFCVGGFVLILTALRYDDSATHRAAHDAMKRLTTAYGADPTANTATRLLLELCDYCPDLVSQDMVLVRMAADRLIMGDYV